jgi:thioesterase domain-containing protein
MPEEHLEQVQPEDYAHPRDFSPAKVPIIFIHDGGGTTFAYHCLDPLKRFVYGIQNPNFHTGGVFAGGLPEMARLYAGWIRTAIAEPDFPAARNLDGSVDIIIGGWSLGGLLSMDIFQELEDDLSIRIVGILMIDSVYPFKAAELPFDFSPSDPFHTLGKPEPAEELLDNRRKNQLLSQQAMADARRMLHTWTIPESFRRSRPRTVLLRATDPVPTNGPGISVLDLYRAERTLGWDQYDAALFDEVIDVPGHHFDLFLEQRLATTSKVVKRAVDGLAASANRT